MSSEELIADFFTKELSGLPFKSMRNKILNIDEKDFHTYQDRYHYYVKNQLEEMAKWATPY